MSGNIAGTSKVTINTPNIPADTTNLSKPVLEILVYGESDVDGVSPDHHLVITVQPSGKVIWDTTYNGFQTIHKTLKRYWSDLFGNPSVTYGIQAAGVKAGVTDVIAISFIKLRYSSTFVIDPNSPVLNFNCQNGTSNQTDFNFTANTAPSTNRFLVLYDLTNGTRTKVLTMTSQNAQISIDNFNTISSYYLYDTTQANKVLSISAVNFIKPDFSQN